MKLMTVEITDLQYLCVADYVVNVEAWIQAAIDGKVNKCSKRIRIAETQRLLDDPAVTVIPPTETELLQAYFNDPGYMNRVERDAAAETAEAAA